MDRDWRQILEGALDGILFIDDGWRVRRHNQAATDLFRAEETPMEGRHYGELLYGEARSPIDCPVVRSRRTRQRARSRIETSSGQVEVTAHPVSETDGNPGGTVCFVSPVESEEPEDAPLYRAQKRFRDVFESANVGKSMTLPNGEIEFNAAFARMLGYEPEEMPNCNWRDITHPDDLEESDRIVSSLLSGERREARFTKRYIHRDGSTVWTDVSSVLQHDEQGDPVYFITTVVDITAQKAIEEAHRMAEERFEKAFFASPAGMTLTRVSDGLFVDANDAFLKTTGFTREEVIGHSSTELNLWSREDREVFIRRQIETGEVRNCESPIRTKSGAKCQILFSSQPIVIGGVDYFVTTMLDITERKEAEHRLAQSEKHYRALFENMNGGFVLFEAIVDDSGMPVDLIIRAANEKFRETTGIAVEDALNKRLTAVLPGIEEDDADWIGKYGGVACTGVPLSFETGSELLERQYSVNAYQPAPGRCAVTFQDVTERHTIAAERADLQRQLQQAMKLESVGRLASGVAHDFNNMLSVILGYGELVLEGLPEDSPLRIEVDEILKAGQRSAELTHQLLAFSRAQPLHPEVVDLNASLTSLQRMLDRIIGEDISLSLEFSSTAGKVLVDPMQLEQIVFNLAANARDAMPDGGRLLIEIGDIYLDEGYVSTHNGVKPGRYTMLTVTDTGPGIPREIVDRVFEPFFTTKQHGKGTGLGLATTYGIVKQSGGEIWVYSERDYGTVFKIYLPVTEALEAAARKVDVASPVPGRGEQILVVEDDRDVRSLIGRVLPRMGYQALIAASCEDAVRMIESDQLVPDMVLTDMIMPDMNGRELMTRLRGTLPSLKSLYMSGYTDHSILLNGALEPGTPFIQKPFAIADLAEKIGTILSTD